VLALVEREKVSFGEAWCTLGVDGVRTYSISFMKLTKDDN
jgi:hypothetical protein